MRRRSFTFVKEFDDIANSLGSDDEYEFLTDILAYAFYGIEPDHEYGSKLYFAWVAAKTILDFMDKNTKKESVEAR